MSRAMANARRSSPSVSDSEVGNFGPNGRPWTASNVIDGPRREEWTSAGTGMGGGTSLSIRLTGSSFRPACLGVPNKCAQWGITKRRNVVFVTLVASGDHVNLALPKTNDRPQAGSSNTRATA